MHNGFVKVAAAVPRVSLADCRENVKAIESLMARANGLGAEVVCFPELSLTGCTCGDLFQQQLLIEEAEAALFKLLDFSHALNVIAIVGVPVVHDAVLYNCAAVIRKGKILGLVPKTCHWGGRENEDRRWFGVADTFSEHNEARLCAQNVPFGARLIFKADGYAFGVEIGDDFMAPQPQSANLALGGADIVFSPASYSEKVGKDAYLRRLLLAQSGRCISGNVMVSSGYGESSGDNVVSGNIMMAENGKMLAEGKRFTMNEQLVVGEIDVQALRADRMRMQFASFSCVARCKMVEIESSAEQTVTFSLTRRIDALPFVPEGVELDRRCEEILSIQSEGLARRIEHTHLKRVVIGISGGLDSTQALLVCVSAFDRLGMDRKGIVGVTMPGFGTTSRTYNNAMRLMGQLGVTIREVSIAKACLQHFEDIGHDAEKHDVTYENAQARERTQILMDIANQVGGLVVGTGDLSELALGWATYNGDHMSMYGVNASVPKTLIKHLVKWVAMNLADAESRGTLLDIIDTPISPELIPAANQNDVIGQKTEDLVGPYELHDFFLYYTLRYGFRPSKIYWLAQNAFNGSGKRVASYSDDSIKHWLTVFCKRFFMQQFKRNCLPDGPAVGSLSLSPRGDWRMPSDAVSGAWLAECEAL